MKFHDLLGGTNRGKEKLSMSIKLEKLKWQTVFFLFYTIAEPPFKDLSGDASSPLGMHCYNRCTRPIGQFPKLFQFHWEPVTREEN